MAEIGAMAELVEAIGTTVMPGDLILQILLRLPALSILRFKSVSRIWLDLFNLPNFIKDHARMAVLSSKKNQQPSSFIVLSKFLQPEKVFFSFVRVPFLGESVNLDLPFEASPANIEVVGSINGLVCLNLYGRSKTIALWNPATREYNFIPDPELQWSNELSVSFGFAYDKNTDCYKVIRILYYMSWFWSIRWMPKPFKAEVYSTKTNEWTHVEAGHFPLLIDHTPCSNVVSGCPYWLTSELNAGQVLMWFDASNDSFGLRHLPQCGGGYGDWSVRTGLGVEGDCPVAFGYAKPDGTKYTTAPRHRITKLKLCDCDEDNNQMGEEDFELDSSEMKLVVGFWKNDKILAWDMEAKLCVYDRGSVKLKSFPVWGDGTPCDFDIFDYTESLVSPFVVG